MTLPRKYSPLCVQVKSLYFNLEFIRTSFKLYKFSQGDDISNVEYIGTKNWMTMQIFAEYNPGIGPKVNFTSDYVSFTSSK